MTLDIDELDRLYAEATAGQLAIEEDDEELDVYAEQDGNFDFIAEFAERKNADFYMALHNAYPALSARVRELEKQVARWDGHGWHGPYKEVAAENASLRAELEVVKREREDFRGALEQACETAEEMWKLPRDMSKLETMRANKRRLLG